MTHDHAEDFHLSDAALRQRSLGSIGLIGSKAKWARFRKNLRDSGHSEQEISRIQCPIGIPEVAGKQPAVIAVSVAAQLMQLLGGSRREERTGQHCGIADNSGSNPPSNEPSLIMHPAPR
ncbi:XdhC family protein [Glutamicibacter halophytocola]|uniref:XdhC family protein n=1 Tax=Glutamicibacter halophytocola TaxID=1933880 RepID=UPI003219947F